MGTTQCTFGTTQCDHVPSRHRFSRIYSDKSPASLEFTHFSPSRGSKAAQAGNSTPMVGKERSTTVPLCFAILQPLSCRPSAALFSSGGSFLQTSSVVEYLREGPFVECVVLELRTTEVEQEPIRRSRRAHIVDNLRPFNTRQILDSLQLNNVLPIKACKIGSVMRLEWDSIIKNPQVIFPDIRDAVPGELNFQRIAIGRLEESITQDSVNSHCTTHDCIGLFVLFQIHAHILPQEEVWRKLPPAKTVMRH